MARKTLLAGLLDPSPPPELTAVNAAPEPAPLPTFSGRGVVGAMSRSLERLAAEVAAARAVEGQLAAGTTAVELDPGFVDPSPVPDRLPALSADAEAAFIAAIRDRGQETPILVRPHPTAPGRYQVAFGHRRLRAAAALGRQVRAFVRPLTDEELVIAQGQENNARADLTFIERASFAFALEERGHRRDVIMAALVVDKTELSRLIAVRRALPDFVVSAIGPAPKAGRRRWMTLAEHLARPDSPVLAQRLVMEAAFLAAPSDERLVRLLAAVSPPRPEARTDGEEAWTARDGTRVAQVERSGAALQITIDERAAPAFGAYLLGRFDELYDAYRAERERDEAPVRSRTGWDGRPGGGPSGSV